MRRKNFPPAVIFFFWFLLTTAIHAAQDLSLLEATRQAIEQGKPFKVLFIQQVFDEDQLEIEESGEIFFKDQENLKWTYLAPDYKVFLLQGDEYKFYDKENQQLTIGHLREKDKSRQWLWQLIFSKEVADYITIDKKNKKISIKNEKESLDIEISIGQDFLPVKAVQADPSGVTLVYHFKNYQKKIDIPSKVFKIDLAEGVEIIQEDIDEPK